MGEQRVPLLLIESDGESTEPIHRHTPFSDTLKLRLLPLVRRPSSSAIRAAICSGVRVLFVSSAILLVLSFLALLRIVRVPEGQNSREGSVVGQFGSLPGLCRY